MANADSFLYRWSPVFLSILRIVVGLLILQHGTQKLFDFPPSGGAHEPINIMSLDGFSAVLEFGGGILLVLGLLTRLAAFILSGEMAVAYFMVHGPRSPFPIVNHGDLAVALCFAFLYIAVAGAGSWSIDYLWCRGKVTSNPAAI